MSDRLSYDGMLRYWKEQALKMLSEGANLQAVIVGIINHTSQWAGENVREHDATHPVKAVPKSPWQPISTAPKDGTLILVTETPNGEHWNVLPACWMAQGAERERMHPLVPDPTNNAHRGYWWGITPSHRSGDGPLHTHWLPLACTPICWMPIPDMEDVSKLNRRMAQLYRS